jgi:hypothetical protein
MIETFFLNLGTFFINYFGKLDTLINTLEYVLLGTRKTGQMCHSVVKISKPYLSYS